MDGFEFEFDGAYSRKLSAYVGVGTCDACGKDGSVLGIDGSEGEYGEVLLCQPCITNAFAAFARQPTGGEPRDG